jgi:hypothetical protein
LTFSSPVASTSLFTRRSRTPVGVRSSCALNTWSRSGVGLPVSVVSETTVNSTGTGLISTWQFLFLLLLLSLRITVEIEIDNNIPVDFTIGKSPSQTKDLSGEKPPDKTNGVTALVVGWNSDIDELGG